MISRRALLGAGGTALGLSVLQANSVFAESGAPWERLRGHLRGDLVLPSDAGYATAKQLDLIQYDVINPKAVAYCVNASDVALCLRFAQDHSVPIAARSGGHSLGGYSTIPGLVIDVSRINSVTIGDGTVKLGAGAQNVDVLTALSPRGLAITGGACATVAAGGFIHGGGIGFLTRALGVASDAVTSAQVVLANGRTVTASPQQCADLYWAVRGGGGGNFGVVTSYTVTPSPVTTVVTANLSFAWDRAVDALDGYARWLADAPRTIGGAAVVTLPDAASGQVPMVGVTMVSTGTSEELDGEIARLLSLTGPLVTRTGGTLPYQSLMMGVYGCGARTVAQCHRVGSSPEGQLPRTAYIRERTRLFSGPMARRGWEEILATFDTERLAGTFHQLQVLALGGAANDLSRGETAYVHRDSLYTVNVVASVRQPPVTQEAEASCTRWAGQGFATITPYSNGETYQNFIDPAQGDWRQSYYAENYWRLTRVKDTYDPYRVFTFAQSIG